MNLEWFFPWQGAGRENFPCRFRGRPRWEWRFDLYPPLAHIWGSPAALVSSLARLVDLHCLKVCGRPLGRVKLLLLLRTVWSLHLVLMLVLIVTTFGEGGLRRLSGFLLLATFVWSDGSLDLDKVSGVGVAGAGVYAHASGASWFRWR